MIRKLAADEIAWFLGRAFAFLGHSDPLRFGSRAAESLREPQREADRCLVLLRDGRPRAGVHVLAPDRDAYDQTLTLGLAWFDGSPDDLAVLLLRTLEAVRHEAAIYPLYNVPDPTVGVLEPIVKPLGFKLGRELVFRFSLSETPPLGKPLLLEAWGAANDEAFRDIYQRAEARTASDLYWSWLKRRHGRFSPDLWFMARESLEQEPVGYALCGAHETGLAGRYYLTAAGVMREYRETSEMLRRVLLTVLGEMASRSPFGVVETVVGGDDPKLARILSLLGFELVDDRRVFQKLPG